MTLSASRSRAFVAALVVLGFAREAVPARAGVPNAFAARAAAFVAQSERRDPLFADSIGIHTYDDALDDYSAAGHARRMAWLRSWRTRIAASLGGSPGDDADAHALIDTIDLELFEDATVRPFHTDPTFYTGVIGNAVYALVGRHYAPVDERLRHIAPRLRAIPGVVAAAEANLRRPTHAATAQAIDENSGNLALYASLPQEARIASPKTRRAIARALPGALASLRDFQTFLRGTLLARSSGNPRVGARVFDRELELADGTNESRQSLVAHAQADFENNRAEMLRLALPFDKRFFPSREADESKSNATDVVVRRVLDRLAEDHPTARTIFATAKGDVAASEAFLASHPVVVLPMPSTLHVVPTPDFMAGFSGASLDPAGPFTPSAESFFYIDKIPATWNAARVASYLRDYNNYEMRMLSMHEAVPGHYVQFKYNARVPSLVRRVFASGSFAEGWAVYTEGMMLDAGYGDGDPRLRLFQLKWRLREEANTIVDAGFHAGDLTQARCFDLLEREAYQEPAEALTKWHRLALSHDQLTSYFVGLDAIRRAQAGERAKHGNRFGVARFNAELLAMGSVEPRFIESLLP
jgi:hypothetical protein